VFLALVLVTSRLRPRWDRRAVVVLLVLSLAVFTFEGGVHSVHHLGAEDAAAGCAVAAASSNLSGVGGSPVELIGPVEIAAAVWPVESSAPPQQFASPRQGRAPPFLA
jgi:hypothetical protein